MRYVIALVPDIVAPRSATYLRGSSGERRQWVCLWEATLFDDRVEAGHVLFNLNLPWYERDRAEVRLVIEGDPRVSTMRR